MTAWSSEDIRVERWSSAPGLGWDVSASPADVPTSPVAAVAVVGSQLVDTAETWSTKASWLTRQASRAARRRQADVWLLFECLAVLAAGLVMMQALSSFGVASWVALGGALCVAMQTHPQLRAKGGLEVLPVLRSLAVVFAAAAVLSALDLVSNGELAVAAWVLVMDAGVIVSALALRQALSAPIRVVVVGDHRSISRAAMRWSDGSVHVVGGVLTGDELSSLQSIVGVPTVTGLGNVADWARGRRADLVIAAQGEGLSALDARGLAWSLERTGIRMAIGDLAGDAAPHRVRARRLGRTTVVELSPTRRGIAARALKSAIDRSVGLVLLLCAAPFLAVTMVLIRFDSPGATLFRQQRVGRDGEPFVMYKLRTMRADAERQLVDLKEHNEGAGVLFKMQDDPRVTRIGRVLRRTSMDELPQLINVVKGQMSLVGPRPALPAEVAEYDDVELRRLAVKPGMTGLWQVSGRSNLDWETSVALDLEYVDNWRVGDDLLIGLRTVGAVTKARGAY